MTEFRMILFAAMLLLLSLPAAAQEELAIPQLQPPILSADCDDKAFPGGLRFSADGTTLWIDQLEGWSVRDGQRLDSSPLGQLRRSRQMIDFVANENSMLIANPKSGELLFWDSGEGLRSRALKQVGKLVAARYLDEGKRFALVFAEPPTIYYGDVDSGENDSSLPLESKVYKCAISPDGSSVAVRNDGNIEIWDVQKGEIRSTLEHEHQPFSFAFSHDGRWIATGTAIDNRVRLYDMMGGALVSELKAHTEGTIFLKSAVYSLAFSPDGKWLASGGHDGRVIVWDLSRFEPLWQAQIEGPPIICSLAFSPDSSLLAGSFENANAKRGVRVWNVPGETD